MSEQNEIVLSPRQLLDIQSRIYEIRGIRVMLDFDLAELYHVETRVLNQVVKRNLARFPEDFMFQLTENEWVSILSQNVMTSINKRPKSALPYAFTEHGLVMLASILHSDVAINVTRCTNRLIFMQNTENICIYRFFVVILRRKTQMSDIMKDYPYTVEELRASVEQGTQQIESGHYYTDAQVNKLLQQRRTQLA